MSANDNESAQEQLIEALTDAAFNLAAPYIRAHLMQTNPEFARRLQAQEEESRHGAG